MSSFELNLIDEKTRAGVEFVMCVVDEMRRAFAAEKMANKITQQSIAKKIGTSRHVINRELKGLENVSARRIGEFFWALGWELRFQAIKPPVCQNFDLDTVPLTQRESYRSSASVPLAAPRPSSEMLGGANAFPNISQLLESAKGGPVPVI